MECRHERRALATSRKVACTEIGHSRYAGFFGDYRRIADLPGQGRWSVRTVTNGLAVATDGADTGRADTGLGKQRMDCLGEQAAQLHIQLTFAFNLIRTRLHECLDGVAYCGREGVLVGGKQGKLTVDRDRDEYSINSIYACSGHEADVVHAASFRQARAAGKWFLRPVFTAARQGMLW